MRILYIENDIRTEKGLQDKINPAFLPAVVPVGKEKEI